MAKAKWDLIRTYRGVPVYAPANKKALRQLDGVAAVYDDGAIYVASRRPRAATLRHEYRHHQQAEAWGFLFRPAYAVCELLFGYDANPFEADARAAE